MLAHGREIKGVKISGIEDFKGGYKLTEEYLIRNNLINKRFFDGRPINKLLTNKVSDHFSSISIKFVKYSKIVFEKELKEL
jgi:hypothetical protein